MSSVVTVAIHRSQFPEQVRRDLLESLSFRKLNHKFLYQGIKQTQKWLALHEACSPARRDPDCLAIYERGFEETAARLPRGKLHLIGLGCGGGQKESRLIQLLTDSGKEVSYTPADVSTELALVARQAALESIPATACYPLVCDLATAEDLPAVLELGIPSPVRRLVTFFGMMPNFEPHRILPKLAGLVRPDDLLLLSANLAPGPDYDKGVNRILPQYDNPFTRDWLMSFLTSLGIEPSDGEIQFIIEGDPGGHDLKRIAAYFQFTQDRQIPIEDQRFAFRAGEQLRLFFSYRHTPARVRGSLERHGFQVLAEWITSVEEEGVFLARRGFESGG